MKKNNCKNGFKFFLTRSKMSVGTSSSSSVSLPSWISKHDLHDIEGLENEFVLMKLSIDDLKRIGTDRDDLNDLCKQMGLPIAHKIRFKMQSPYTSYTSY